MNKVRILLLLLLASATLSGQTLKPRVLPTGFRDVPKIDQKDLGSWSFAMAEEDMLIGYAGSNGAWQLERWKHWEDPAPVREVLQLPEHPGDIWRNSRILLAAGGRYAVCLVTAGVPDQTAPPNAPWKPIVIVAVVDLHAWSVAATFDSDSLDAAGTLSGSMLGEDVLLLRSQHWNGQAQHRDFLVSLPGLQLVQRCEYTLDTKGELLDEQALPERCGPEVRQMQTLVRNSQPPQQPSGFLCRDPYDRCPAPSITSADGVFGYALHYQGGHYRVHIRGIVFSMKDKKEIADIPFAQIVGGPGLFTVHGVGYLIFQTHNGDLRIYTLPPSSSP